MANETQIYGHIKNKHDLEVNWLKAVNFTPKDGELIIYEAETTRDPLPAGRTERYATPRLKIGDGKTNVNDLPFVTSGSSNNNLSSVFYVTLTREMGAYLSDVTYAQIKAAYDAGNGIYCKVIGASDSGIGYSDFCLPLTRLGWNANSFIFQGTFGARGEEAYNVVKSITVTISSASNNVEFSTISSPQIYDLIEEKTEVKMKIWTTNDMGGT